MAPAHAADDAGSLDNIWVDQGQADKPAAQPAAGAPATEAPAAAAQTEPAQAAPAQTPPAESNAAQSRPSATVDRSIPAAATGGASLSTVAPMCTFEEWSKSALAGKGGWPGLGPFKAKADNAADLADPAGNRLRLTVDGDKITMAELSIARAKPQAQDFLDLEMGTDFLLESLGSKGNKIARLNADMEKNKQSILFKSDSAPVNLNAGRYLVYIQRQPAGAGRFNYSIRVNSRDIRQDVLKEHTVSVASSVPLPGPTNSQPEVKANTTAESGGATGSDALKEEFTAVIRNWQKVKKVVVRQRQADELASALYGRALQRQTDAVKWLVNNRKYYDMSPLSVAVFKYTEIIPGIKYLVSSQVKESSKLIDEDSGKVLKESTDTYKVNYTIEKIQDRWLISDSAIIAPGQAAPAPKAAAPGKASR